jgi:hypothetical protein
MGRRGRKCVVGDAPRPFGMRTRNGLCTLARSRVFIWLPRGWGLIRWAVLRPATQAGVHEGDEPAEALVKRALAG